MKKYFFISIFSLIYCLSFVSNVYADTFEIHFLYDEKNDLLNFDNKNKEAVQRNPDKNINQYQFEESAKSGKFEYSFFDISGYEMERKQFDPQPGSFTVELPYYSIAKTLKIRRSDGGEYFLTKDISNLVSCNANQICEYEQGENMNTCLIDCANGSTKYNQETEKLLDENNGVVKDPETGEILLRKEVAASTIPITATVDADSGSTTVAQSTQSQQKIIIIIVSGVILVGAVVGIYFWRRRRA